MNLLTVSGISKKIDKDFSLQGIDFSQAPFRKIAIAGETGSGKSTLLKIIAGLVQPDAGTVLFKGERVKGPNEELVPGHPRIAYLSQHFELRTNYRVEEVLEYANTLTEQEAFTLYTICRIDHLLKRRTDQLSGGEKQRIALARLLTTSPELLLLDEPFSNLDMIHKSILKSVIRDIGEQLNISCMMVSHDPLDTLSWADEIIVMKDGKIIQQGTPKKVYAKPVNEYAAGLLGKYNLLNAAQVDMLLGFAEKDMKGKRMLIRPEQIIFTKEEKGATQAIITDIAFHGVYHELELQIAEWSLTAITHLTHLSKGDKVYFALPHDDLWYL